MTRKKNKQFDTFRDLTPTDEYYFDYPHAPQRICLRFSKLLDPMVLCQALDKTSEVYPGVYFRKGKQILLCGASFACWEIAVKRGAMAAAFMREPSVWPANCYYYVHALFDAVALSKVAMFKGKRSFHVGCEDAKLCVIVVPLEILNSPREMSMICDKMQQGVPPDVPLFSAFVFRCKEASKGCAVVSCFHHVLGDATCYSVFMRKWSEFYHQLDNQKGITRTPANELPTGVYQKRETRPKQVAAIPPNPNISARRYLFTPKFLASLKKELGSNPDRLTTNDLLLAQCMCALGPLRRHALGGAASPAAYVALLADHRGRGLDEDSWGNATVDLSLFIPWGLLESGDAPSVARELRRQIKSEFDLLGSDLNAFNARRMDSAKKPRLFCWNSWVKAGKTIVGCDFGVGSAMQEFEWLNLLHHTDIDTVLCVPVVSPQGTIAVQVRAYYV